MKDADSSRGSAGTRPQPEELYAGFLSAAFRPGIERWWLRAIVDEGQRRGFDVERIYEERRRLVQQARGVQVPSYHELMLEPE